MGPWSDDVGWKASEPSLAWATLGGILAAIVIGIPMTIMGNIVTTAAALVGSESLLVGWAVHLFAGAATGFVYGLVVATRDLGHGAAWGALYGLLVGLVPVWLGVSAVLDRPLGDLRFLGLAVMMHVVWGVLVGAVQAWGLRQAAAPREEFAHSRAI